jgi:hypothetical protein
MPVIRAKADAVNELLRAHCGEEYSAAALTPAETVMAATAAAAVAKAGDRKMTWVDMRLVVPFSDSSDVYCGDGLHFSVSGSRSFGRGLGRMLVDAGLLSSAVASGAHVLPILPDGA